MRSRLQLRLAAVVAALAAVAACRGGERNAEVVDSARATADTPDAVSGFGPATGDTMPPPRTADTPGTGDTTRRDSTTRPSPP